MEPKFDSKRVLKLSAFLFVISILAVYYIFEFDEWLDDNQLVHKSKQGKLDEDLYVNNQDDVKKLNHVDNDGGDNTDDKEDSDVHGGQDHKSKDPGAHGGQDHGSDDDSVKGSDSDEDEKNVKASDKDVNDKKVQNHEVPGKTPDNDVNDNSNDKKRIRNPTGRRLRY